MRHQLLAVALFATGALDAQSNPASAPLAIAFIHVTVIDSTGLRPDQTVVVAGGRIGSVTRSTPAGVPPGAQTIDARGLYLIPGLWDMHVHMGPFGADRLGVFVLNGVTGVRDLGGLPDSLAKWIGDVDGGRLLGPRIVMAGRTLAGPAPGGASSPFNGVASTAEEGRAAVRANHRAGAHVIKVWSSVPREAYLAALDEARKVRLPVVGHPPYTVSMTEILDGGQRGLEHLIGIPIAMSRAEDSLLTDLRAATNAAAHMGQVLTALIATDAAAIRSVDPARRDSVLSRIAGYGVAVTPTLTDLRAYVTMKDSLEGDDRLSFLPLAVRNAWVEEARGMSPSDRAYWTVLYQFGLDLVGRMRKAGVRILPGTDAGSTGDFPGFDLHTELALLAKAGLTPREVLNAATVRSAEEAGLGGQAGLVAEGQLADLVLLEVNPLADIRNTRRIAGVVQAGRYFDRRALADLRRRLRDRR